MSTPEERDRLADIAALRQHAEWCRTMAGVLTDRPTVIELLTLAIDLENEIGELEGLAQREHAGEKER